MALKDRISDDMKDAMKAKDAARLGVLRMLRADILKAEKEKGEAATDEKVVAVLQKLVKQRRDSAGQYTAAGQPERAAAELADIPYLEAYLPESLSDAEIDAIVDAALAEAGEVDPKQMGKLMGRIMGELKATGKPFDGKAVNELVRGRLAG